MAKAKRHKVGISELKKPVSFLISHTSTISLRRIGQYALYDILIWQTHTLKAQVTLLLILNDVDMRQSHQLWGFKHNAPSGAFITCSSHSADYRGGFALQLSCEWIPLLLSGPRRLMRRDAARCDADVVRGAAYSRSKHCSFNVFSSSLPVQHYFDCRSVVNRIVIPPVLYVIPNCLALYPFIEARDDNAVMYLSHTFIRPCQFKPPTHSPIHLLTSHPILSHPTFAIPQAVP
jgi:hypothetical protein